MLSRHSLTRSPTPSLKQPSPWLGLINGRLGRPSSNHGQSRSRKLGLYLALCLSPSPSQQNKKVVSSLSCKYVCGKVRRKSFELS